MEKSSDLVALAREFATKEDLYKILNINSIEAQDPKKVQSKWRQQSLKYHPDKVGDGAAEREKWELLEKARNVMLDAAAREAYDSARSAALRRQEERQALDAKKRAMIDDLEARERGETPGMMARAEEEALAEAELKCMAESGRRRAEERKRLEREAEERERQREEDEYNAKVADLEGKLKDAKSRKAAKAQKRAEKEERRAVKNASKEDDDAKSRRKDRLAPQPSAGDAQTLIDEKKIKLPTKSDRRPLINMADFGSPDPSGNYKFSQLMEMLRAVQAEKDRRRAEAAV